MASRIAELFGYGPADSSPEAAAARRNRLCPFVGGRCAKTLSDGQVSGVCALKPIAADPVICCPIRLYADGYKILRDVASIAFGRNLPLVPASNVDGKAGPCVAVFGKGWGKELRLPSRARSGAKAGAYFVDWVLARIDLVGQLADFAAVEVQSIDTTGNYRAERDAYLAGQAFSGKSSAGFNWENVNKRILPQIIYKGHVLRQEPLCQKGLFFVCPAPVFRKISERLGDDLRPYPLQPGALTFLSYGFGSEPVPGTTTRLSQGDRLTTTIDQVALAFTAPRNLPPAGVYEQAIRSELEK